jgi:hypothetical protein
MADPIITKVEVHEYKYTLENMGRDYNGCGASCGASVVQSGRFTHPKPAHHLLETRP